MLLDARQPFPYVHDGIHVLPVLHGSLELADAVREAFERLAPDGVVVELPSSLERSWRRGIERLPAISVLLYENSQAQTIYLPIHPADPCVEASRLAAERGATLVCGDLDVDGYADYRDAVPDPYAVLRLGLARFYASFHGARRRRDLDDDRREASLAFHAQKLRADGRVRVLLVCGMHHAAGVAEQLARAQAEPLTRPERRNVRLVHLHPESLGEVLSEIPFVVAVHEARRAGPPAPAPEPSRPPHPRRARPFRVIAGGGRDAEVSVHEAIAQAARESFDRDGADEPHARPLDRLALQRSLLRAAEETLSAVAPDEEVRPWQRLNLARFSRNLALAGGRLLPDLFDLLAAARGCVSENFAYEAHRVATTYPAQGEAAADLPTARIRADELWDGVRRLRITPRHRRPKRPDWRSVLRRRRRDERWPGEWLEGFDGEAICSYPPEDVIVEQFGRYLQRRGKLVMSEERARTVPFTTSVLDGIDVRETIRHWSDGRIWVRELGRAPGNVGSVVVIFDEDEARYPYLQTWIGEHDQESDMAFYCTEPAASVVGPGICRVTYGGFLLSSPPQRMLDVWTDSDYRIAETRGEVLLLAALDYTTEKVVVHVGPRPPRSILQQLASRLGLKILHLPLGTLSPATLRKIRVMHILSGHEKRSVARDFIW